MFCFKLRGAFVWWVWKVWKLLRNVEGKGHGDEVVSLGRRKEGRKEGRLACRGGRDWVSVT